MWAFIGISNPIGRIWALRISYIYGCSSATKYLEYIKEKARHVEGPKILQQIHHKIYYEECQ
jgi:hypothetical protein